MCFRKQLWNRLIKWVFHLLLSKANIYKKPLSILLPHPCPRLKQGSVVLHLLYFRTTIYQADDGSQGFFQCSLQVWKYWSPESAKTSVKNSSSLKPLINDKQVSIHAQHFMQIQNTATCRMVNNCICLQVSTEALPAQGQTQRRCCPQPPSSGGELQSSAQGAGMLSETRLGRNLDTAGYFEKGEKNWLTLSSSLIPVLWLFLSPRDPFGQTEGVGRLTELLQSRCDSSLWKEGGMYWIPL